MVYRSKWTVIRNRRTYENTGKIVTDQGHDYTTGCLLDYTYFKNYLRMVSIDLSK